MENKTAYKPAHNGEPVGDLDTENELINHRLSWLLAGQSLLLLAFGNLVSARVSDPAQNSVAIELRERALKYIPRVGYWSAFLVLVGVLAAIIAFIIIIRRDGRGFGVHWSTTIFGFVPPVGLPLIFMIAWYKISKSVADPFAIAIPAVIMLIFLGMLTCALRTSHQKSGSIRDFDGGSKGSGFSEKKQSSLQEVTDKNENISKNIEKDGPSGIIVGDGTIDGERPPQRCKTKSSTNIF